MLGFIGSLFVGIFGLFDKVFGKKKYAVEFEDTTAKDPAPAPAPESAPAPAPAVPAAAQETASKSKKTSVKKSKSGPAPKAEPVKAATVEAAKPVAPKKVELKTFAPDYLVPSSTGGRRFGGPSLNSFREMARQMPVKK